MTSASHAAQLVSPKAPNNPTTADTTDTVDTVDMETVDTVDTDTVDTVDTDAVDVEAITELITTATNVLQTSVPKEPTIDRSIIVYLSNVCRYE